MFGFGEASVAGRWVTSVLAEKYRTPGSRCERIVLSDRNVLAWVATQSGPMIAKWSVASDQFPRLAALADLTAWLAERGVPVSAPIPALGGSRQLEIGRISLGLQRQVDVQSDGPSRALVVAERLIDDERLDVDCVEVMHLTGDPHEHDRSSNHPATPRKHIWSRAS